MRGPNATPGPGPTWSQLPPAAGAAVMATGIISVGLNLTGHSVLSGIFLALAAALWIVLAADFASRLVREHDRWRSEADTPPALTAVAATTVLGTRISMFGWQTLAEALLALAALVWPVLLVNVVRHWKPRMPGGVFLGCVATQGLVVLAATLASAVGAHWLAYTGMVLFWGGVVLYCLALLHFDLGEVAHGAGDQWVAGGALAISALAASKLVATGLWNEDDTDVLRTMSFLLFALDAAWYVVLALAEVRWPRPRYDVRRWSTVFPLGMTAAAALSVGAAADVPWLRGPGQVLVWIAVAVWLATLIGTFRSRTLA
ncbi:tellurite resistance/C4-dicarboxylate transporter family protein [Streptomyces sp. NBC_00063]|uniref:tellurite resistance/C4-dicarboxylate transporter family protein n=1 Tax=Streptomyces sp. NBC_00063 TaxID=2975638 RepID=UPI002259FEEF|nr:tellurite resistance/C4-dicarboxylate transporter family protein [Streptomyces sp. NBC_00063]MCX5439128.1 tellurite resistance/C4-dicarboxylate transporter family protein [Streptomyces sp. NBC_00063]